MLACDRECAAAGFVQVALLRAGRLATSKGHCTLAVGLALVSRLPSRLRRLWGREKLKRGNMGGGEEEESDQTVLLVYTD